MNEHYETEAKHLRSLLKERDDMIKERDDMLALCIGFVEENMSRSEVLRFLDVIQGIEK